MTRGYTVTIDGRSLSFLPADVDAANSNATVTVYKRTNGSTVDSLTLTNAGESGRFTYRYVGSAFWQRTTEGTDTITGSFDALAYGVRTPAAGVPRAGRAQYAVDLVGVETLPDNVVALTGQGTMQVDFATGAIVTTGTMAAPITGNTVFSSEARLASSSNAFSGTFRYWDFGELIGSLTGAFYGPNGEEVGAAYEARGADGRSALGALIGRRGTPSAGNASLTSLAANEFFANDSALLTTTLSGRSGMNATTGTFTATAAGAAALTVSYNAQLQSYSLLASDRSQYFGPDRPGGTQRFSRDRGTISEQLSFPAPEQTGSVSNWDLVRDLQYVRAARWLRADGGTSSTGYAIGDFAYGIRTADGSVPRTGSGGFVVSLNGNAADADYPNLTGFTGSGTVNVDFASGKLTGSGRMSFREDYSMSGRATGTAIGSFSLEAAVASAANAFAGTLSFTGIGNYSGSLAGRFYGPAAEELGGSFSATDGSGGAAAGSIVGRRDPSLTATVPTLRTLSGNTELPAFSVANPAQGNIQAAYVAYDASSGTYGYYPQTPTNAAAIAYRFGPAQAVSSATNATFSGYAGSGPAGQFNANDTFSASLLNPTPENPRIALTYTSYADITVTSAPMPPQRQWVIFGVSPPESQLPRTGTGNYSGIVFGHGDRMGTALDVDGTATLSVDFAAQSFRSVLSVMTRPTGSGAFSPLPTLEYTGSASQGLFFGNITDPTAQGQLRGRLFGANAAEFGLLFNYTRVFSDGRYNIIGGAVGKRD